MKFIILYSLILSSVFCIAQEKSDCELKIISSENLFKQGLYKEAESKIKSTLDSCSLKRKNKIESLELLARIYVETDNIDEANLIIKKLLQIHPNYEPDQNRLEEDYLKYFSKFKVTPTLSIGAYSEFVFPKFTTVGNNNFILNDFDYSSDYTANKLSSVFGLNLNFCFPTNTRISFQPGYLTLNYFRKISHKTISDYYTTLTEKDNYITLPIELNQHVKLNKFTFYIGLGYAYSIINNASAEIYTNYPNLVQDENTYIDLVVGKGNSYNESKLIDLKNLRSNINSLKGNLGITYNLKNFIFDLKYSASQALNFSNSSEFYLPDKIMMRTNYIDNNFFLKSSSINFSINYILLHKVTKQNNLGRTNF
jgi:hypothetical protein